MLNLTYRGAVRTPPELFHYSGKPASVDLHRREYILGRARTLGRLAMVPPSLPQLQARTDRRLLDLASVPVAPLVGDLLDRQDDWRGMNLEEVCVVGSKALISGSLYYDAGTNQEVSFFACDWPEIGSRTEWRSVKDLTEGWAAGPMTIIPERFRSALQGDVLFGQPGGLPIIGRQSYGPCAIAACATDFLDQSDVPARLLLGYHDGAFGAWGEVANDIWQSCTTYTALVFVGDYVVFIGAHGYGQPCYGEGVNFEPVPPHMCYDPTSASKGTHAYPYRPQATAYRVSDLGDVAAGVKQYHELAPAFWQPLDFPWFDHPHYAPTPDGTVPRIQITGAEFDSERCELHVCAFAQDGLGYEPGPLWHVFGVHNIPPMPNPVIRFASDPMPAPVPTPEQTPDPAPPVVVDPPTPADPAPAQIAALEARVDQLEADVTAFRQLLTALRAALAQ